jgi:transcriptional regulator with XRE-family HTH domain
MICYCPEMDRIGKFRPRWRIREWRDHRGLTQEQLAERANMTKSMISEIESGKKRLHDDHIAALSFALGVEEPGDLLRNPRTPTPDDLLRGASPEQRQEITDFVEFIMRRRA